MIYSKSGQASSKYFYLWILEIKKKGGVNKKKKTERWIETVERGAGKLVGEVFSGSPYVKTYYIHGG